MFARVTLLEIDTLRVDMREAVDLYRGDVVPELRQQPGYAGALVLTTPEGKGVTITFWETAEQADSTGSSGFYPELLGRYTTLFRAPPGREHYEVALAELPAVAESS